MASYGVSDVSLLLRESAAEDWHGAIRWLRHHAPDASAGIAPTDRADLLEDLAGAREAGIAFVRDPGELYRALRRASSA